MKIAALAAAAALALLAGLASAETCPTLRVTAKAPRTLRNNKLHTVSVTVKNTGTTAASSLALAVGTLGYAVWWCERLVELSDRLVGSLD